MPSSTQPGRGGHTQLPIPERKPDYYISSTGHPVLTSHRLTTMHRSPLGESENGTKNSKLNKCLYNTAIRNGGYFNDRHGSTSSRRVNDQTEHDITSAAAPRGRCSKSSIWESGRSGAPDSTGGRHAAGLTGGWSATVGGFCGGQQTDRCRSVPAATRLLAARSGSTKPPENCGSNGSNRPGSLVLQQQCRYSNHRKQLDNRLSYQRSYDRNIFGYDQRMDQFVLPPLQI